PRTGAPVGPACGCWAAAISAAIAKALTSTPSANKNQRPLRKRRGSMGTVRNLDVNPGTCPAVTGIATSCLKNPFYRLPTVGWIIPTVLASSDQTEASRLQSATIAVAASGARRQGTQRGCQRVLQNRHRGAWAVHCHHV